MNIKLAYATLMKEQKALKTLEAEFNQQKKKVDELREEMVTQMQEAGTDTYKSDMGTISLTKSLVPTVNDWDALYNYIHNNQAYELLQRRVTTNAWRDRIEEEGAIPGTESFEKATLRITLKK